MHLPAKHRDSYAAPRAMMQLALALLLMLAPVAAQKPPSPHEVAGAQGRAESALLDWTMANSGGLKGEAFAAGLRVTYTITAAEGCWELAPAGTLDWQPPPATGSFHLRIFVAEATGSGIGRLLSTAPLHATLIDSFGNEQPLALAYGWYPLINAYGGNIAMPRPGSYRLRVSLLPLPHAATPPHEPVTLDFPPMELNAAALASAPVATDAAAAVEAGLLRPANAAMGEALTALWKHSEAGEERAAGDYYISYALAPREGELHRWLALGGALSGKEEEPRLTLLIRDARTGRLIHGLAPQVTLSAGGKTAAPLWPALAWSPWLTAYRADAPQGSRLPAVHVSFAAPGFRRWGRESRRFSAAGEIDFPAAQPAKSASGPRGSPAEAQQ